MVLAYIEEKYMPIVAHSDPLLSLMSRYYRQKRRDRRHRPALTASMTASTTTAAAAAASPRWYSFWYRWFPLCLFMTLTTTATARQGGKSSSSSSSSASSSDDSEGHHHHHRSNKAHVWLAQQLAAASESPILSSSTTPEFSMGSAGLVWTNLSVVFKGGGGGSSHGNTTAADDHDTYLLRRCSGVVYAGQVCGVLGPSGAGKTTLVSALAGALSNGNNDNDDEEDGSSTSYGGGGGLRVTGTVWKFQHDDDHHHHDSLITLIDDEDDRKEEEEDEYDHLVDVNDLDQRLQGSTTTTTSRKSKTPSLTVRLHHVSPEQVAWLQQHDTFFEMLTVTETMQMAAFLELPHLSKPERQTLVQHKLEALGLARVAQRRIGSYFNKPTHGGGGGGGGKSRKNGGGGGGRLSGGERRRLSVALELLTDKDLFIADEPTTGLDTSMSGRVMKLIHDTAQQLHIPALCVLHQPRSSVWHALDVVILMATGGRVCYAGDRAQATEYFARLGYPCPEATNPAEFLVDLISVDHEDPIKAAQDEARVEQLAQAFAEYQNQELSSQIKGSNNRWGRTASQQAAANMRFVIADSPQEFRLTPRQQRRDQARSPFLVIWRFGALLRRSWRQNIRNQVTNMARFVISVANAFLLTQLFPTVRGPVPMANSMADRAALLTTAAIVVCSMSYMKAADLFEKEYPVVRREQVRQQYSTVEYLLAKVLAEIPLDCAFAALFATVLKKCSGIRIGWQPLTATFALLTAAGASLGFALGSIFAADGLAVNAGLPVLVILMLVGVINPSGVDPSRPPPVVAEFLKKISPFSYAVEAILIAEYRGMEFVHTQGFWKRVVSELPRMGAMAMVQNGNQVLDALGLATSTYGHAMTRLLVLTLSNLALSWVGLWWQQYRGGLRRRRRPRRNSSNSQRHRGGLFGRRKKREQQRQQGQQQAGRQQGWWTKKQRNGRDSAGTTPNMINPLAASKKSTSSSSGSSNNSNSGDRDRTTLKPMSVVPKVRL